MTWNTYAVMVKITYTNENDEQKYVTVARNVEAEISNAALIDMLMSFPEDERYMVPFMNADKIVVTCELVDRGEDWEMTDEDLNSDE